MAKTTTGYVDLDDGELYYEMADDGDTLVLGHAGFVDSRMWDAQWDAFTQKYRVIRFDMRGYGKSDSAAGPRTRRNDLFQLLDHLHVERAALLGCSLARTDQPKGSSTRCGDEPYSGQQVVLSFLDGLK